MTAKDNAPDPAAMPEPVPSRNDEVNTTDDKDLKGRVAVGLKQGDPHNDEVDTVGAVATAPQDEADLPKLKDGAVKVEDGSSTVTPTQAEKLRDQLG